jgi:hypothetical protein
MMTMPTIGVTGLLTATLVVVSAQSAHPVTGRWIPFQHAAPKGSLTIEVRGDAVRITNTSPIGPPTDVYRLLTIGDPVPPPHGSLRPDGLFLNTMEGLQVEGYPSARVPSTYDIALDPAGATLRVERRRLQPGGGTHVDTFLFVRPRG